MTAKTGKNQDPNELVGIMTYVPRWMAEELDLRIDMTQPQVTRKISRSNYVASLVSAHLGQNPEIPIVQLEEDRRIETLQAQVAELQANLRMLHDRIARMSNQGEKLAAFTQPPVQAPKLGAIAG